VLQYGAGDVAAELDTFLVERAATRGISVTEDEVVVTNGSSQAIDLVCRVCLDRGDFIMSEAPTFMGALRSFRNFSVTCLGFELDDEGVVTDDIEEELVRRRKRGLPIPKFFYTIPNHQNPKGVTMSLERRRELLELASEFDFIIVEDDAYGELRFEGEEVPTLKELDEADRVVHVGTFSKVIGPGVRTGWALAPPEIASQLGRLRAGGTNGLTQSTVAQYCQEIDFDERVQWLRESYRERRDVMLEALDEFMPDCAEWGRPEGGFFIWAELPEEFDTEELLPKAAERGVAFLNGGMFFPDGTGNNCMRLGFSYAEHAEIREGIRLLGELLKEELNS
jgi:2-aminoadipate transaminase